MEETATSLLVSIATSKVSPVVVLPMVMGRARSKKVTPLTCCTRAIAPATGAAGAVVKLQTTLAPIGVPAALVTVPATVAVKTAPAANGVVGVRVAMVPVTSSVTVAGTFAAAPAARRLKVAVTLVLVATPVALGVGDWAVTVGATGAAGAVVKLQTTLAPIGVPAAL